MMLGSHRSSTYAPVPAVCSRSQPWAWSPLSCSLSAFGLAIKRNRSPGRNMLLGRSRWKTTVVGDGVSTRVNGLIQRYAAFFRAWARSTESLTAVESNGVPSLNLTPSRSLKV